MGYFVRYIKDVCFINDQIYHIHLGKGSDRIGLISLLHYWGKVCGNLTFKHVVVEEQNDDNSTKDTRATTQLSS